MIRDIGQRLTDIRHARGMTQLEVAKQLGIAQAVLSRYERGNLRLHGELILRLANILKVSSDEILGLKPEKSNGAIRNRRLARILQQIEQLPRHQQQAVLSVVGACVAQFGSQPPAPADATPATEVRRGPRRRAHALG